MEAKNNYYSKLELGMTLNVCVRTIDNWIAKGMISYSKLGKRVIFSQRDLDEFIERNRKDDYLY
jgi:excisionase family DNA binding protein